MHRCSAACGRSAPRRPRLAWRTPPATRSAPSGCARPTIRCLPAGPRPLRVLHLSDLHLTPAPARKQDWSAAWPTLEPDLVVNTGDNLAHRDAVARRARGARRPARRARRLRVRLQRLLGARRCATRCATSCPTAASATSTGRRCRGASSAPPSTSAAGLDLTNRRDALTVSGVALAFAGVDDPHLELRRARRGRRTGRPDADLRIGVAHAPYLRVLDAFARDGYDAIFAGHTHGGQSAVPATGRSSPTATSTPARAGSAPAPGRLAPGDPARPGCTSRPGSGRRRTPRSGSAAAPRRPC